MVIQGYFLFCIFFRITLIFISRTVKAVLFLFNCQIFQSIKQFLTGNSYVSSGQCIAVFALFFHVSC